MGLAEPLAKRIIATYELYSSLGWFTGVMMHGKQIDGTPTKLAIITVYCPLPNRGGGAWTMMQNCLTARKINAIQHNSSTTNLQNWCALHTKKEPM
jgi:hypothetical protein